MPSPISAGRPCSTFGAAAPIGSASSASAGSSPASSRHGFGVLGRGASSLLIVLAGVRSPLLASPVLVIGLTARFFLFLAQQRLPVGDRDLVVVGMDFREGEEAVAVAAVIDEGRLQRRLDARHLGEIDVAF